MATVRSQWTDFRPRRRVWIPSREFNVVNSRFPSDVVLVSMTRSSSSSSKSVSCEESVCSEEEKVSDSEGSGSLHETGSDKVSDLSEKSNRTDATYTCEPSANGKKQRCKSNCTDPQSKSSTTGTSGPKSRLQRTQSSRGILEPTTEAAKRAQWLPWNDPAFARRRSTEDNKFRKPVIKETGQKQRSVVASYKRSLQLLGLQTTDLGMNEEKDKRSDTASSRGGATPTFSTKLKQRSVSLTNLRNAVQESGLSSFHAIEKMHRDVLARAVYEEWYFRKLAEERKKRALEIQIQKKKEEEIQWLKLEQRRKAEDTFEKWKKRKAEEMRKGKDIPEMSKNQKPQSSYLETRPHNKKAFELWKAKKDEEEKAKADLKRRMEEEKQRNEKERKRKADAEAAFKAWKQQADEELKEKMKELEKKKKEIEKRKEEEMNEKKRMALACYESWKKKKDEEVKQKIKVERLKTKRAVEDEVMKKLERLYEAAQAFEEWLDQVEEKGDKGRKKRSDGSYVPPWYPAGMCTKV